MKFEDLKERVFEWSRENFGDKQPPEFPLIGGGEEAGELTTSVLKRAQGIDDSEKYDDRVGPDAEKDAIGDIFIYLADFAAREQAEMGGRPQEEVLVMMEFYTRFGDLCRMVRMGNGDHDDIKHQTELALASLGDLADLRGYELEDLIEETWEEVSGREWDSEVKTND